MDLWLFHIHTQGCSWDHPVSTAVLMVYLRLERGFHWRKTSLQLCERWPWKNQKLHVIYWLTNLLWSRVCRRVAADPIAAECLAVDNLSPIFYYLTVWMLRLCKYWVGIVHTVHKVDTNQLLSVLGTWKIKNQKSQCIAWFFRQGANSTPQGKFTLISSWSTQTFNNSWLAVEPLYWIRSGLSQRRGWQCCPGRPCSHARSCACQPTSKHITPVQRWQCIQIIWMLKFFTEQFRKSIFIILNAPDCVKSGRERLWYIYTYKNALTAQLRAQIARKQPSHLCETLSLCRWLRSRTLLVSHQRRRLPRRSTLMCNFQKDAKSESAMPEMGVWWWSHNNTNLRALPKQSVLQKTLSRWSLRSLRSRISLYHLRKHPSRTKNYRGKMTETRKGNDIWSRTLFWVCHWCRKSLTASDSPCTTHHVPNAKQPLEYLNCQRLSSHSHSSSA